MPRRHRVDTKALGGKSHRLLYVTRGCGNHHDRRLPLDLQLPRLPDRVIFRIAWHQGLAPQLGSAAGGASPDTEQHRGDRKTLRPKYAIML